MVPKGWKLSDLGSLGRWSGGGTPSKSNPSFWANGTIPWVSPKDMWTANINSAQDYITADAVKGSSTKTYPAGSVLVVTRSGILRKRLPVSLAAVEVAVNQDLKVLPPNSEIDTRFIANFLWCFNSTVLSRCAKDGTTVESIDTSSLMGFPVKIPPINEQKKIAQILSTWDKAITTTEQLLANSQQQKKALMQQLLTGKKRIGEHYGAFEKCRFSDLLRIDSNNLGAKTSENFPFTYISLSDVKPGKINSNLESYTYKTAPSRARRLVKAGDVLMSTVRPNLQGFVRVSHKHNECVASTGFSVLSPKEGVCGDYIYHYLFSAHIKGQINSLVVGSNYPAISSSDVARLCVYCPSYQEQVEIAAILNYCDSTIESLSLKLDLLLNEKKALMQQLLTGKRRVQVDEDAA